MKVEEMPIQFVEFYYFSNYHNFGLLFLLTNRGKERNKFTIK